MKKVLLLIFISLNVCGQAAKLEAIMSPNESGNAIRGIIKQINPLSDTKAIEGVNYSINGLGVGVYGSHAGYSAGVYGTSDNGTGTIGYSLHNNGVWGYTYDGIAGLFKTAFSGAQGYALKTEGKLQFSGGGVGTINANKVLKSINSNGDAEWSDLFPYYISKDMGTGYPLSINNTNPSSITATIYGGSSSLNSLTGGVRGDAHHTSPTQNTFGLRGNNYSGNSLGYGVIGNHSGTGIAVKGETIDGTGGHFESTNSNALITGKGKVGIGNAIPNLNADERMEINGRLRIRDSTNTAGVWFNNNSNGIGLDNGAFYGLENAISGSERAGIWIGSAWRFFINRVGNASFSGTVTATGFPIASDLRYKKNIQPLENPLSKVQKIVGVSYDLRKDEFPEKNFSELPQVGFIAQDLEKIFPEMVFTDEKGYKSVDYARLTPVLVEALKELTLKNQTLESRLDKIEAMLSTIQPNTENLNSKK